MKIAIVGCGNIADAHAEAIKILPGCELISVCDTEELMAKQMAERFQINNYFTDVKELLLKTTPEVVHITTPPQSHFALGATCLEHGCNIYMEKPFTVNTIEAQGLIDLANKKKLKVTVGHDHQFGRAPKKMRELINDGYLGGAPVHMESYYCYDFGDERYAKALLGDTNHWVRKLPGGLLHNIISHGISKISEFLQDDNPEVIACGFVSPFLNKMNQMDIIDELRVIIKDNVSSATAYFTFSSQVRPVLHQFRIYGPKNGLSVDYDNQTLIKIKGTKYKSYLGKFIPQVIYAKQYFSNSMTNINCFLKRQFHMKSGMSFLIESFYDSIKKGNALPISYKEIILTAKIMDAIFKQIK